LAPPIGGAAKGYVKRTVGRMQPPDEVVYEFLPPEDDGEAGGGGGEAGKAAAPVSVANAQDVPYIELARREAADAEAKARAAGGPPPRPEYERICGRSDRAHGFEPPEQRLSRLRAEIAELLSSPASDENVPPSGQKSATGAAATSKEGEASEPPGGDPTSVASELQILQERLNGIASDSSVWGSSGTSAKASTGGPPGTISRSLLGQLERLAAGDGRDTTAAAGGGTAGTVTYELSYTPSTSVGADVAKLTALEGSVAEIEKRLGVLEPNCPFTDLQTAITQLQKKFAALDNSKIDTISRRVHVVMGDVDAMLTKKTELEGVKGHHDDHVDQKVSELYEMCHRWTSTAAALPGVLARLQSLKALHQKSASFSQRLAALEAQQEELTKLIEATNTAVQEMGGSLKENIGAMQDNMKSLETKIMKVVK